LVKKGFPNFGITQSGAFVAALKNYNLPDFVLALVAKDCNSDLLERGRIQDRLSSMNDESLELFIKSLLIVTKIAAVNLLSIDFLLMFPVCITNVKF